MIDKAVEDNRGMIPVRAIWDFPLQHHIQLPNQQEGMGPLSS
jgi:hypothetical protein